MKSLLVVGVSVLIIVLIVGTAITLSFVSENKVWMAYGIGQCDSSPWANELTKLNANENKLAYQSKDGLSSEEIEIIKKHYKNLDLIIYDVSFTDEHVEICEACGCNVGTYLLLISEQDKIKAKELTLRMYQQN